MTEQEVWCSPCQEVSRTGSLPFWWCFLLQSHLYSCHEFMNRNSRSLAKYCLPLPTLLLLCLPSSTLQCVLPFSFLVRALFDHLNISLCPACHVTGRKRTQNSSTGLGEKSCPADGYIVMALLCSWDCNLPVGKSRCWAQLWWYDVSLSPRLREL